MADKTWKAFERRVAKFFGTVRTPLSGENSGHKTNSDTLHPSLYVECKHNKRMGVINLFKDTQEKAGREKKTPVLALTNASIKSDLLVMRKEDLKEVFHWFMIEENSPCVEEECRWVEV